MAGSSADTQFVVEGAPADPSIRLLVSGEIDVATSPRLRQILFGLIDSGSGRIDIDLSGVTFLDSSGLGVLVAARNRLRGQRREHALAVRGVPDSIRRVFEITGLDDLFDLPA